MAVTESKRSRPSAQPKRRPPVAVGQKRASETVKTSLSDAKAQTNAEICRTLASIDDFPTTVSAMGENLAVKQVDKVRAYHSLFKINWAFRIVTRHLQNLAQTGLMPAEKMWMFSGFSQELQAQISHDVVDQMHEVEDEEMFRYGKIRIAREHHLNPDRPPFQEHKE